MMDLKYLEILKAPVVTEKSEADKNNGVYTFKVDPKANKIEIKQAIEKKFGVKVVSVRTLNVHVKTKKVGRYAGLSKRCKKAFVKLAEGKKINLG